ncbi:MAG: nucleoside hydrolase [Acidobacteriota bacterium]
MRRLCLNRGSRFCGMLMLASIVGSAVLQAQSARMKVILDTDIGDDIDDAWALAFVLANPRFEPLGVTIAHGNTPVRARIACKMLHQTKRDDIPVLVGRKTSDHVSHQYTWAEDFDLVKPAAAKAADWIVETVKKHPGEVTLIAVGPLQNVADALRKEPELGRYLKRVVLMSGCVYGTAGKPKPIPEYNVYSSTADAQLVYAAGLPLTIVPLDATTHVRLSDEEREQVKKHDSPLTFALECLYRLWLDSPSARMTLHDQLAVAEAASPGEFFGKVETLLLRVDDEGFTRIDHDKGKSVAVCLQPRRDAFMRYYISYLVGQSLGK